MTGRLKEEKGMLERTFEKFINWKFCTLAIVWSLVGYWIGVSGWQYMFEYKLGIALAPIVFFVIHGITRYVIKTRRNRQRQKEIMLNVKVRRILDQYVA